MNALERDRIGFAKFFFLSLITGGIYSLWYRVNTTETQIELLQELALQGQKERK